MSLLRSLSLLLFLTFCLSVSSRSLSERLNAFEREIGRGELTACRSLLEEFEKEGVVEEMPHFDATTPKDTVRKQLYYFTAYHYFFAQQHADCAAFAQKSLDIAQRSKDTGMTADCLTLLAISRFRQGDYKDALVFARQCYALDKQSGNKEGLSSTLNTLAGICLAARQYAEAETYVKEALALQDELKNPARQAIFRGMASEICHALGREEEALTYARQALETEKQLNRPEKQAIRLTQMAAAYVGLKRYAEARQCLDEAMPQFRRDGNELSLGIACNLMGDVLSATGGSEAERVNYFSEAAEIFKRKGDLYNESYARQGLYDALKNSQPSQAMLHLERLQLLKDSIYNKETSEELGRFNAAYGNERLREQHEEALAHRRVLIVLLVSLLFVALTGGILLRQKMRRERRRHCDVLARFREELEAKSGAGVSTESEEDVKHHESEAPQKKTCETDRAEERTPDTDFIERVADVINQLLEKGDATVEAVAESMCMTPSRLRRHISKATGQTPQSLIINARMVKAAQLLRRRPDLNVTEVAQTCGFDSVSNFVRAFKKHYGVTPRQYAVKEDGVS